MRTPPALAVAVLILTAGCVGSVGSDSEQPHQFGNVDLSNASQVDGLFEHHHSQLANASSYTANATYHRNGSRHRSERITVSRSEQTARIVDRYFSSGDRQERVVSGDDFRGKESWQNAVQLPVTQFVAGLQFERVERTDDRAVFDVTGLSTDAPVAAADSVSGTLILNGDGVITHLSVTIDYEAGGELESSRYEYEVTGVGSAETTETG